MCPSHDITYKKITNSDYGEQALQQINHKLKNIMEKYLKPAGLEFQNIMHDYQSLLQGKRLFDAKIESILNLSNNDERYSSLETYLNHTLQRVEKEIDIKLILNTLNKVVLQSRNDKPTIQDTPYSHVLGKSNNDILAISLRIAKCIILCDHKTVINWFFDLYSNEGNTNCSIK